MTGATTDARPEITSRGRASRDRVVQAALALMLEQGVAATTIDEILERAGASKSQMYHYFSGRAELVEAVIDAAGAAVLAAQQPFLTGIADWDTLVAWTDQVVALNAAYGVDLGCPLGTLAAELSATHESARLLLERWFEQWTEQIRVGLRTMQSTGRVQPDADIERLALAVIASLQGGLLLAKTTRTAEPIRVALDSALAFIAPWVLDS